MPVSVLIPTPLRKLTANQDTVAVEAANVDEMVRGLEEQFPGLGQRLRDENGELRRFINIYVNDEDIRFLQGKTTPLKDGDSVSIVPAIAGGL
ncbi:MAG TPA: MoaD/ThiS family protein [Capsulimonadaceae bacterium]|nr:MoaD/ThiS family protein [Capsulimonadaceae bacterium]